MKTLQNDYTTPEQSKRLLELGVPEWTANYKYGYICSYNGAILDTETVQSCKELFEGEIPLWSLGRLIEIELTCREEIDGLLPRLSIVYGTASYIEELIRYMERRDHKYNFNKLED